MVAKARQDVVKREFEGAAGVYSVATRNRVRAVLDVALEMLTDPKNARRDPQGRDVYECLADAVLADPLGAFERLEKMLPKAPEGTGSAININHLYLQALQAANKPALAPVTVDVVDVTPEPGVQSGSDDW